VVADQRGSPTYAADLADALIAAAVAPGIPTVLHYAGAGDASWYELAAAVFEATGHDPSVITLISSVEYATRAPRPRWSVLSTRHWTAAGLPAPTPWREAVARWAATVRGERTDPEPR
jgi:dTDP-4-dehydrorhamnose reductase